MAARAKQIALEKAKSLGMLIKVPPINNGPRASEREWRLRVKNTARHRTEISGKQLGAASKKRAVTMLARALRKAPGDPEKLSSSQLSSSLVKPQTWRFFAAELLEDRGGELKNPLH